MEKHYTIATTHVSKPQRFTDENQYMAQFERWVHFSTTSRTLNSVAQLPKAYSFSSEDHGFVSRYWDNSKISLGFGNPLEKQTSTNATVHQAVMGSWEENVTIQCPCRQYRELQYARVGPFPMISGVIAKSWERLQLEWLRTSTFTFFFYQAPLKRSGSINAWLQR